jgi:hypothetical protein
MGNFNMASRLEVSFRKDLGLLHGSTVQQRASRELARFVPTSRLVERNFALTRDPEVVPSEALSTIQSRCLSAEQTMTERSRVLTRQLLLGVITLRFLAPCCLCDSNDCFETAVNINFRSGPA